MTDDVLDLIARLQSRPETATAYLGTDVSALAAELDGLDQPWRQTLRTVETDGRTVAAAVVEWDEEVDTAWVHGPWLDCPPAHAMDMLADLVAQAPVGRSEMFGDVRNAGMAELARLAGWEAGRIDHSYVAQAADLAAGRPSGRSRPATTDDLDALTGLHEAEFPDTYASPGQLLRDYVTLVHEDPAAGVVGYASGQVRSDGSGYVDFTAVAPSHRRRGIATDLLAALVTRLDRPRYALTVSEQHEDARRLYEALGWRHTASLRAYRSVRRTRRP